MDISEHFAPDPTPAFNERCLLVIAEWEHGRVPYSETRNQLLELGRDAQARNHPADLGRVEHLVGYMEHYRGNLNVAIHHYERARALYNQVANPQRVAVCDMNMGESYRYKGDFNRARALFERAYQAFQTLKDIENEAFALGNKGQMLLSMGRLDDALRDLTESCRLALQLDDNNAERHGLLCEVRYALASLHLRRNHHAQAWAEARAAYELAERHPSPLARGYACRAVAEVLSIGRVSLENGFTDDPDHYFHLAIEAFQEIHVEGEIARTMYAHALSLLLRGRRMTAARKLQMAMIIFTRLGMVDDAARAAEAQLEVL